jgi:hypothetical protein
MVISSAILVQFERQHDNLKAELRVERTIQHQSGYVNRVTAVESQMKKRMRKTQGADVHRKDLHNPSLASRYLQKKSRLTPANILKLLFSTLSKGFTTLNVISC